jgi:hypothetical protein
MGIGTSTLMRQIIEEWVETHSDQPPPDHVSELVRVGAEKCVTNAEGRWL